MKQLSGTELNQLSVQTIKSIIAELSEKSNSQTKKLHQQLINLAIDIQELSLKMDEKLIDERTIEQEEHRVKLTFGQIVSKYYDDIQLNTTIKKFKTTAKEENTHQSEISFFEGLNEAWKKVIHKEVTRNRKSEDVDYSRIFEIKELSITNNSEIKSLEPLSVLTNLQRIYCSNTQIENLEPISELVNLKKLSCSNTLITTLEPISNLVNLKELNCSSKIESIEPIRNLTKLKILDCSTSNVISLEPLCGLQLLKSLDISQTSITDISPLFELTKLRKIICCETSISNEQRLKFSEINPFCEIEQ